MRIRHNTIDCIVSPVGGDVGYIPCSCNTIEEVLETNTVVDIHQRKMGEKISLGIILISGDIQDIIIYMRRCRSVM